MATKAPMGKSRMEAFSDGIFAIAITILILEIKIPEVEPSLVLEAFLEQGHKFFAFVLSFVIIGMYWTAHHAMVHSLKVVDRTSLWLNILNLLFICFLPYPTAILGEYPNLQFAIVLYSASLICVNTTGTILWLYTTSLKDNQALMAKKTRSYVALLHMAPVLLYLVAIAAAFSAPLVSYAIFVVVPLFFIIPNRIVRAGT